VENVAIADNVSGPGGTHQQERNILCDQRFEKRLPRCGRSGRKFIGEIDQLHPVLPVQPSQLPGETHRIPMPPLRPESTLTAVAALIRATPRKLHHHRALAAPVRIIPVIDQLPSHAEFIEIANHGRLCRSDHASLTSVRDSLLASEVASARDGFHQSNRGAFPLAADDEVNRRAFRQNLPPAIGRIHTAIDDDHPGQPHLDPRAKVHHGGMHRARTRVTDHHHFRRIRR
jgi:hypothetical protein